MSRPVYGLDLSPRPNLHVKPRYGYDLFQAILLCGLFILLTILVLA